MRLRGCISSPGGDVLPLGRYKNALYIERVTERSPLGCIIDNGSLLEGLCD